MRRLSDWTFDQIISYNLRGGGNEFTIFADAQKGRVDLAKALIDEILINHKGRAKIVEPGCSAGDISGPYSENHDVYGIDVTPGAANAARERYPKMRVDCVAAEHVDPIDCDILVLCEFLEHIVDPVGFAKAWMPRARNVIIGHPLVGDGHDPEAGHLWAYNDADFLSWFPTGGHELKTAWQFDMGYRMVIGRGERVL